MKYEGPTSYKSKDTANVSYSGQTNRQTNKWTGQKIYAPDLSMQGHTNIITEMLKNDNLIPQETVLFFCK